MHRAKSAAHLARVVYLHSGARDWRYTRTVSLEELRSTVRGRTGTLFCLFVASFLHAVATRTRLSAVTRCRCWWARGCKARPRWAPLPAGGAVLHGRVRTYAQAGWRAISQRRGSGFQKILLFSQGFTWIRKIINKIIILVIVIIALFVNS